MYNFYTLLAMAHNMFYLNRSTLTITLLSSLALRPRCSLPGPRESVKKEKRSKHETRIATDRTDLHGSNTRKSICVIRENQCSLLICLGFPTDSRVSA